MMNDVIIIMGASQVAGTMPLYLQQLSSAGIPVHVEPYAWAHWIGRNGTLQEKIEIYRQMAHRFREYERLVFTDAWDVTFYGTKEELIERIPNDRILLAAEKNCYPDPNIAPLVPDRGPWRFANGGAHCGTPEAYLAWCDAIDQTGYPNMIDQGWFNYLLSQNHPAMQIDHRTELFFCLFCGYEELEFIKGKPHNTLHDTHPLFVHANGKWDYTRMLLDYEASLC